MEKYYTSEKNTQILIALMKAHGVRKIVASPGTTNVCLVGSLQQDPYFEIYSSVDERSAAYIACGLAAESGEPVALSCTGATASRNYVPGLTEAFYRKLPVLAVTSTQHIGRVGQLCPQVIDRSNPMNDIAKLSVQISTVHDKEDEWAAVVAVNNALLELKRHGGGPVHINLTTTYSKDFSVKELPLYRKIDRICYSNSLPQITGKRIGIFVGAHKHWTQELTECVDRFCELYNGAVFCDLTSNYHGKYRVLPSLVCSQEQYRSPLMNMDVMIHIGDVSGAYISMNPAEVWRVNPDGEIRDVFKKIRYVFEMEETDFFKKYIDWIDAENNENTKRTSYYQEWISEYRRILDKTPELPFSNAWLAETSSGMVPEGSILHLGILNTLRTWNFFEIPESVDAYSNTGGFGIDGLASTLLGASLADKDKLHFAVIGDLAFFYDMNVLGNRHIGKNLRLMVVNNGRGTEFRIYSHPAQRFGDNADPFMAAAGHYGNQSRTLLKHYAEDLGFEYLSAATKEEYKERTQRFFTPQMTDKPMLFEVFTNSREESTAVEMMYNLEISTSGTVKKTVKKLVGEKGVQNIKKMMGRD